MNCKTFFCILDIHLFSVMGFAELFSHSVFVFSLFYGIHGSTEVFSFDGVQFIFSFVVYVFGVTSKNSLSIQGPKIYNYLVF